MPNGLYIYSDMFLNKKQAIVFTILAALVSGISLYKISKVKHNSHFDPSSPGSLYYAEAAFHYRYAEIAAKSANPFNLFKNDTAVQHPEIINIFKYETVMMELFYGFLYRIANFGLPFNLFLIYATCLFSSLAVAGVFLIARRLSKDDAISLGAALFYATTPASYLRTAAGSFLREDFTLVFVLISVLLITLQLKAKSRPILHITSGMLIVFNLSSWHFNNFIYICTIPFFFWIFAARPELLRNFFYSFLPIFAAGFLIPVLKTRGFTTSILMCGFYTLFAAYFLGKPFKKPLKRFLLLLAIFAMIMGIRIIISINETAYSHVFDMFMEKLKFLLRKPDNPSLLSFSARQLWESAFNSPAPSELWWFGKLTFPLGLIGSILLIWNERKNAGAGTFVASLSIILLMLSIMAKRIIVVAAPFLAITLSGCFLFDKSKRYLKFGLFFLLILNSLGLTLSPIESGRFTAASYRELFQWVNSHTQTNDVFVAHIHVSPMILLNTGRPEVLHPKFENIFIRKKYEEFITSIYSDDEEKLFKFCKKNQAGYLVYDWGFFIADSKDSMRYLGEAVPDIPEKTIASRLHFCDPTLRHFRPVFRNSAFIVYEVMGKSDMSARRFFSYSPIYDSALYTKENEFYKNTRQTYDTIIIPYAEKVNAASVLLNKAEAFMAADLLRPVVGKIPHGGEAVFVLSQALVQLKQFKEAEEFLREYLKITDSEHLAVEPLAAKIYELYADTLYYQGRHDESFDALAQSLKMPSHSPDVYKKLGILKGLENKTQEAQDYLKLYEESIKH